MRRTARCLAIALVFACASSSPQWVPARGSFTPPSGSYTIDLPEGWMRLAGSEATLASRDGIFLQRIDARTHKIGVSLGSTQKVLIPGMAPREVADTVRDAINSSGGVQGMKVLESVAVDLDGRPGFRLVFAYTDRDGLKMKSVVYGAVAGDSLYELSYRAPGRHYFDRDLETFEQVRSSFRIRAPVPPQAGSAGQ